MVPANTSASLEDQPLLTSDHVPIASENNLRFPANRFNVKVAGRSNTLILSNAAA